MMTMLSEDIVNNIHVPVPVPVACWLMDAPGVKYVQLALSQVFVVRPGGTGWYIASRHVRITARYLVQVQLPG